MFSLLKKYKIKDIIVYVFYIPQIVLAIKNRVSYLKGYNKPFSGLVIFRNGLKLKVQETADISSISVIFFKKEYGTIQKDSTILDIGANRGYFSIYAATAAKNVKIYAFEPISETYDSILQNIALNNLSNSIMPFNVGVAGVDEIRKFSITSSIETSMVFNKECKNSREITCISLKTIIENNNLSKIDLIKIDCEGAEFEIFLNTPKEYLDRISAIRMEYHDIDKEQLNIEYLKKFLQENNFKVIKQAPYSEGLGIIRFKK